MGGHVRNLCESTLALLEGPYMVLFLPPAHSITPAHSILPAFSACVKKLMALTRGNRLSVPNPVSCSEHGSQDPETDFWLALTRWCPAGWKLQC